LPFNIFIFSVRGFRRLLPVTYKKEHKMSLRGEATVLAQNLGHRLEEWGNGDLFSFAHCKKCARAALVQDKALIVPDIKYLFGSATTARCDR
jgi:hypothetical protein